MLPVNNRGLFNYEVDSVLEITITVTDDGTPVLSTETIITVKLIDVNEVADTIKFSVNVADSALTSIAEIAVILNNLNDNPPVLLGNVFSIDENPVMGAVVDTLKLLDADGDLPTSYAIELISGDKDTIFTIDLLTMNILVNKPYSVDYERRESYEIQLEVADGIHTVVYTIIINVNDIPETGIKKNITKLFKLYPVPADDINVHFFSR